MAEVTPDITPVAKIVILGIGGGGSNAINRMIKAGVRGVEFVAVNTDAQALSHNDSPTKLAIGRASTKGLGAGAMPEVGRKAAEESIEDIRAVIEGADMVFVTACEGGGTGTGASPIIAQLAKEMGILTVAVVTKPFSFEGPKKARVADDGVKELKENVDTVIVIPNDRVLALIDKKTPLTDAFMVVDDVLRQGISGISDLITRNGIINVDFADIRTIMKDAGTALMGIGYGTGENRAIEAARQAIDSPLLEMSINGAKNIVYNITGGSDLSMFEVDEASRIITEAADPDANIIFGVGVDDDMTGEIKITVVAAGFDEEALAKNKVPEPSKKSPLHQILSGQAKKPDPDELDVPAFMRKTIK
ncbi:MAG: cell division protein FtsZ [Patescibacteria group bacterium]|nr:cell division protein FtsZ [Patescibacteria group bacterium]